MVTWLAERSVEAVRDGLRLVAPHLADGRIELHDAWVDTGNPMWSRSSAFVDDTWVVKFAWTEVAARKLVREWAVIDALGTVTDGPRVARLAARSSEPAMFVAPLQPGRPLAFEVTGRLNRDEKRRIGDELAQAVATFHDPGSLAAVEARQLDLPSPTPQADTQALRRRLVPLLDDRRADLVRRWCDWTDAVLAQPAEPVLLHGDFHGYNAIFDDEWRVVRVLDLEEASIGDRHYDFRYLPAQELTVDLLRHTVEAYERIVGVTIDLRRVMAWHVRTVCGDALWRTEAQVPLPSGGNPSSWIDELADRFDALSMRPEG